MMISEPVATLGVLKMWTIVSRVPGGLSYLDVRYQYDKHVLIFL